jgi:hypothetical protein
MDPLGSMPSGRKALRDGIDDLAVSLEKDGLTMRHRPPPLLRHDEPLHHPRFRLSASLRHADTLTKAESKEVQPGGLRDIYFSYS